MSWNNGSEYKKFRKRMDEQAKQYRELGMPEEAIMEMEDFDTAVFRKDRAFYEHNQSFGESGFEDGTDYESGNALSLKFTDRFSEDQENSDEHSRYWWTEQIDNTELAAKIKKLSSDDIELLTLFVFEEKTKKEISVEYGCSDANIIKKFNRIKNFLA